MTNLFRFSIRAWIVLFLGFSQIQAQQNPIFSYSISESPDSTLEIIIYCDSPDSVLEFIEVQVYHDHNLEYSQFDLGSSWFDPDNRTKVSVDTSTLPNTILCTLRRGEGEELSGSGIVLKLILSGHGIIENIDLKRMGLKLDFNDGDNEISIFPNPLPRNKRIITLISGLPLEELTIRSFEGRAEKTFESSHHLWTHGERNFKIHLKIGDLPPGIHYITSGELFIGRLILL